MKRMLALLLAMLLLSSAAMAEELKLKAANPDLYPVTDEAGAELSVWARQVASLEDFDTNLETIAMEKLTGVHINWQLANHTEVDAKFNLSIASGIYPDIYLAYFSNASILSYVEDGIVIPLNDLIEENTYWLKEYMRADERMAEQLTAPDGNIYTLWLYTLTEDEKNIELNLNKLWYFKPWMEQYTEATGKGVPETLDELCDYLRYIRDNDMNGNGDATDEIPLLGTYQYDAEGSDPMYAIMSCFQILPSNFLLADEAHNVTCAATTDAFREGLIYLNGMYNEELFPEEVYSLDLNQYRSVVNVTEAKDMLVGVAAAPYWMRFVTQSIYVNAYDDFTFLPPLKKDADTPAQTAQITPALGKYGAITSACEDPVLAIKWLDAISDPELSVTTQWGVEGVHWTRESAEGELPILYKLTDASLTGAGSTQNIVWQNWTAPNSSAGFLEKVLEEGSLDWKSNTVQWAANNAYREVGVVNGLPASSWCTDMDLTTEQAELSSVMDSAISTGFSEFILGRRDPSSDADWQAYLDNLNALGLERYLEVTRLVNFGE